MNNKNKTIWKIQITGDVKYLEDLILIFKNLNFENYIYKEDGNYFLNNKIFNNINNIKDLIEKANAFLTIISTFPSFRKNLVSKPIKIEKIIEMSEDKKLEKIYDSEGNFNTEIKIFDNGRKSINISGVTYIKLSTEFQTSAITKNGKIISHINSIEDIKSLLLILKNNNYKLNNLIEYLKPALEKISQFSNIFYKDKIFKEILEILNSPETTETSSETLRWVNLYKIYELIREDAGGEENLKKKEWFDKKIIENFKRMANYYRHSKSKNSKKNEDDIKEHIDLKNFMDLNEAEQFISDLFLKYTEDKLKSL